MNNRRPRQTQQPTARRQRQAPRPIARPRPRMRTGRPSAGAGQANGFAYTTPMSIMNTTNMGKKVDNKIYYESGDDFLGTIKVKGAFTTVDDQIVTSYELSPSLLTSTRLARMSELFESYKFTSLRIVFKPSVGSTSACQLVAYIDTDPTDDPSGAADRDQLVRTATAHTGNRIWNFTRENAVVMPTSGDGRWYYTGPTALNIRQNVQAKFWLLQSTEASNLLGEPVPEPLTAGSLQIYWTVAFKNAQISKSATLNRFFSSSANTGVQFASANFPIAEEVIFDPSLLGDVTPNAEFIAYPFFEYTGPIATGTNKFIRLTATDLEGKVRQFETQYVVTESAGALSLTPIGFVVSSNNKGKLTTVVSVTQTLTTTATANGGFVLFPLRNTGPAFTEPNAKTVTSKGVSISTSHYPAPATPPALALQDTTDPHSDQC